MFYLVPQIFIILSLGGIVFIFLRKIIRIEFKPQNNNQPVGQKIQKFLKLRPMAKNLFKKILVFLSKIWHIMQNIFKKLDNILEVKIKAWLEKIKHKKQTYQIEKEKKSGIEAMILEKKCIDRITKHPKDVKAYEKLGLLYIEQKNFKNVRECFEHVLKLEPGNQKAKKSLEEINMPS